MEKLRVLGHVTDDLRSKSWLQFTGPDAPHMDFVITLCDTPRGQECPDFGDMAVTAAWPLPDPAKFTGSPVERAALLNELYARSSRGCPPHPLGVRKPTLGHASVATTGRYLRRCSSGA